MEGAAVVVASVGEDRHTVLLQTLLVIVTVIVVVVVVVDLVMVSVGHINIVEVIHLRENIVAREGDSLLGGAGVPIHTPVHTPTRMIFPTHRSS